MKKIVKILLPNSLRKKIESLRIFNKYAARRLAVTSKRIDICAAQFAHVMHLSGLRSLEGKVCLELGSGWVLSHAIVCYLLGAKKVFATDISPIAHPEVLDIAIKKSISSIPRDILSSFSDHEDIRMRYDRLLSISRFTFEVLNEIGIEYISPIDMARERFNRPVDFIYSTSVLEHVPCGDVVALIENLVADIVPGGCMIHSIHLEDHRDFKNKPFDFLSVPGDAYNADDQTMRGNRLRKKQWIDIFNSVPGVDSSIIYEWSRDKIFTPEIIDPSIKYKDKADLRVSHLGLYTKKLSNNA